MYSSQAADVDLNEEKEDISISNYFHPSQFDKQFEINEVQEDISEYVSSALNYILFMNLSQKMSNCTTSKIMDKCFPEEMDSQKKRFLFKNVMSEVREHMQHLFGFDLLQDSYVKIVQTSLTTKIKKEAALSTDKWYLFNENSGNAQDKIFFAGTKTEEENEKYGKLMLLLANIVLEEFTISEELLLERVKEYGIKSVEEEGDYEYLLKEFVALGYLKRRPAPEKDSLGNTLYYVELGKRTYLEIGLNEIFTFMGQTCGIELTEAEKKQMVGVIRG